MPRMNAPTAQRAYTLRLQGADPKDLTWREALWRTHESVNKGAKAFGDWLLTLRGGLDHRLVDTQNKGRNPTDEERKARRILLALSWLSVESKRGAPATFVVADGTTDDAAVRGNKVITAFEEILRGRGVANSEIEQWTRDCEASLTAAIRDDAVWVNRSDAFDVAVQSIGETLTRDEVWDMLERFFGSRDRYLTPAKSTEDESSEVQQEEKAKDLGQKAGQWLSSRFGQGEGANFEGIAAVYHAIAVWADEQQNKMPGDVAINHLATALGPFSPKSNNLTGVLGLMSGPGYRSATRNLIKQLNATSVVTQQNFADLRDKARADFQKCHENSGSKGRRPYSDVVLEDVQLKCGLTYLDTNGGRSRHREFTVMLDHAARRVSLAHTWIKRAEAGRSHFEEASQKKDNIPELVQQWLDAFCERRTEESGALEPYRIRRRAVTGWKEVVGAWTSCTNSAERINKARELQNDPEIEKFGDIQLFEALAQDEPLCVWHKNGDVEQEPDSQLLLDYALAAEAEFNKRRFKVPAYRHPDALLHPVFCDFGNSRWSIEYEVHEKTQSSDPNALKMTLISGLDIKPMTLRWQSKRLARDLALSDFGRSRAEAPLVARADRMGRAVANATQNSEVKIEGLFEEEYWNGRLQAPRRQLEAIATMGDRRDLPADERERRISSMRNRIRWLVTFSAKLQQRGPWHTFAENLGLKTDPKFWPHSIENKYRKGQAKLLLPRLRGLRLLSVDLGHRHAAACAVWEAVDTQQIEDACRKVGRCTPNERDLYLHLKRQVTKQIKGRDVVVAQTTVYRRVGADTLLDGTVHPAPWARLERQFLIKLQGEEEGVRAASHEEIWKVHQFEAEMGRAVPIIDRMIGAQWGGRSEKQKTRLAVFRTLGWVPVREDHGTQQTEETSEVRRPSLAVDELMSATVQTMSRALKRHGDRARIAFAMTKTFKSMPGDRKYYFSEAKELSANEDASERDRKYVQFTQDVLLSWYDLVASSDWRDNAARQLWDAHIAGLTGYKAPEQLSENMSRTERKKKQADNRDRLYDAASALAQDVELRQKLHELWKKQWEEDDRRWRKQLRWFRDWILPRGKRARDPAIRKTGGLSLTRLATLTEFRRKIQVGFFTRLKPDGIREQAHEQFGQYSIDALERLREQRVKQLASRIVEAALGIGRVKRAKDSKAIKRPDVRVDEPCHAIVIENLTHYRPEETRTRRENRQLMVWSSSKVKKYLDEACALHGLHLREVQAGYTSRQDSRTGAPGIRCQDVPVSVFMRSPFWRKQIKQAEAKRAENKGDARSRLLCELNEAWKNKAAAEWEKAGALRIPLAGGEIFVSAYPGTKGLQADLNAAANIGLRALMDPDWPGRWWYVPCESASYKPVSEKVKGSAAIKSDTPLISSSASVAASVDAASNSDTPVGKKSGSKKKTRKTKSKSKEVVNLWRDISSQAISVGGWCPYAHYQNVVQHRVVEQLRSTAYLENIGEQQG